MNRYQRQIIIKDHGISGQDKLYKTNVLIIGCGGLGSPIAVYLAACGVGHIGIVDGDIVDLSNLHRQVWYKETDVRNYKAEVLAGYIKQQNSDIEIDAYVTMLDPFNAEEIIKGYDIVVDGTDNFQTRYLINDVCVHFGKPLVFGAIYQYEGQVSVFNTILEDNTIGPNYRDLFPDHQNMASVQNCNQSGVIGVLPGIIGTMQAMEVINLVIDGKSALEGKLLTVNAKNMDFHRIKLRKTYDNTRIDYQKTSYLIPACTVQTINHETFQEWTDSRFEFQLIDVRTEEEYKSFNIKGKNIPLDQLLDHIDVLEKQTPILFVCQSGIRSQQAVEILTANSSFNWKNLYSLVGGLSDF